MSIALDASRMGWGASCWETCTGGTMVQEGARAPHKLLGTASSIPGGETFLKGRLNADVQLRLDSRTAVTYVNNWVGQFPPRQC